MVHRGRQRLHQAGTAEYYSRNDTTDGDWPAMIWDKGANTLLLTGTEMRQISGISEQNAVNTALLELMHRRPDQILTLWTGWQGCGEQHTPQLMLQHMETT